MIAAYHSVVVTNIREVSGSEVVESLEDVGISFDPDTAHKCLVELKYIYENVNRKNFVEYYHDAIQYHEELFTLFNLGYIKLKERAIGEELFHLICRRTLYFSSFASRRLEEFEDLQKLMVSRYLAIFRFFNPFPMLGLSNSYFQSCLFQTTR